MGYSVIYSEWIKLGRVVWNWWSDQGAWQLSFQWAVTLLPQTPTRPRNFRMNSTIVEEKPNAHKYMC